MTGVRRRIVTTPTSAPPSARPAGLVGTTQRYHRDRRKLRRPKELLQAIAHLDPTVDPQAQHDLIDWISEYYSEANGGELIGMFSKCYLGAPYVDHQLSLAGSIVDHYRAGDMPPPQFAMCRPLARSDSYVFIEVYSDGQIVPIRLDGTAAL